MQQSLITSAGRAFLAATAALALAIGALQMNHVHGGILTDYGADAFGTAWIYAMTRLGKTVVQRGRTLGAANSALVVFALCTLWELGQRVHLVPGTYDPVDIATYAAAVLICWAIDRLTPFVGVAPRAA